MKTKEEFLLTVYGWAEGCAQPNKYQVKYIEWKYCPNCSQVFTETLAKPIDLCTASEPFNTLQ